MALVGEASPGGQQLEGCGRTSRRRGARQPDHGRQLEHSSTSLGRSRPQGSPPAPPRRELRRDDGDAREPPRPGSRGDRRLRLVPGPGVVADPELAPRCARTAEVSMEAGAAGEAVRTGTGTAGAGDHHRDGGVGYADGYARRLTNVGQVLIRGGRHGVAGTVTMDQMMVDVRRRRRSSPATRSSCSDPRGRDHHRRRDRLRSGTISYEVVCAVGERVPRRYRG